MLADTQTGMKNVIDAVYECVNAPETCVIISYWLSGLELSLARCLFCKTLV
jgi:hypothetical protein